MRFIPPAFFALLLATPATAGWVYFSGDPQGVGSGCVTTAPYAPLDLYVIADPTHATMMGISFRVPAPECPGVSIIGAIVPTGFLSVGDVETGIQIALGACLTENTAVLKLQCLVATSECCELRVLPHPSAVTGEVEIYECNFDFVTCRTAPAFVTTGVTDCNYSPPPFPLYPVDGATNVPLPVSLSWDVDAPHVCTPMPLGIFWSNVYFGTDPDPPLVAEFIDPRSFDPGPLDPATMYYWKVDVMNYGYWGRGAVWSFTTENATPAESKTWGAVKALYR